MYMENMGNGGNRYMDQAMSEGGTTPNAWSSSPARLSTLPMQTMDQAMPVTERYSEYDEYDYYDDPGSDRIQP